MHPNLINIGPFTVRSYGTMIVLGFFIGLWLIKRRARNYGIPWEKCVDLAFYLLLGGIIGSKIFYWLILPDYFLYDMKLITDDPIEFIKNFGSGFEFFGALFSGVIVFLIYTSRNQLPRLHTLDLLTPSIPLAHAFGRIGCFLAGCCYGRECSYTWSIIFNHPDSLAPQGIALHPTQLYESALLLLLTGLLLLSESYLRKKPGMMLPAYVIGYTVIRFIVEYFRGDPRGSVGRMTMTQLVAILAAVIASISIFCLSRSKTKVS